MRAATYSSGFSGPSTAAAAPPRTRRPRSAAAEASAFGVVAATGRGDGGTGDGAGRVRAGASSSRPPARRRGPPRPPWRRPVTALLGLAALALLLRLVLLRLGHRLLGLRLLLLGPALVGDRELLAQLGTAGLGLVTVACGRPLLGRLLGRGDRARLFGILAHSGGSSPKARTQIRCAAFVVAIEASAPSPARRPDHIRRLTRSLSVIGADTSRGAGLPTPRRWWRRRTAWPARSRPPPRRAARRSIRSAPARSPRRRPSRRTRG